MGGLNNNWHEGAINGFEAGPIKYQVKAYARPSENGIQGGCISKLWMARNGKTLANYDRGWDIKPDKGDQDTLVAYYIILQKYNGLMGRSI